MAFDLTNYLCVEKIKSSRVLQLYHFLQLLELVQLQENTEALLLEMHMPVKTQLASQFPG